MSISGYLDTGGNLGFILSNIRSAEKQMMTAILQILLNDITVRVTLTRVF